MKYEELQNIFSQLRDKEQIRYLDGILIEGDFEQIRGLQRENMLKAVDTEITILEYFINCKSDLELMELKRRYKIK